MPIKFPSSRTLNQSVTTRGVNYKWDGRKFKKLAVSTLEASNLTGLEAQLTSKLGDEVGMPDAVLTVSTAAGGVYKFTGDGFPSESGNNPDMYFERGKTYCIHNSSYSSHPLAIRVSNGGAAYTSGVTGASSVKVTFTVPMDAPDTLVYQCTNHASMVGNIYVTGKAIKGYALEVVTSLPGSPDANTIYFVTG